MRIEAEKEQAALQHERDKERAALEHELEMEKIAAQNPETYKMYLQAKREEAERQAKREEAERQAKREEAERLAKEREAERLAKEREAAIKREESKKIDWDFIISFVVFAGIGILCIVIGMYFQNK